MAEISRAAGEGHGGKPYSAEVRKKQLAMAARFGVCDERLATAWC